jgi:hypothetical protein
MTLARDERGAAFMAVLVALLIAAALYFGYFKLDGSGGERRGGIAAIDTSREFACRTNRQTIERAMMMWSASHPDEPPTLAALAADGIGTQTCPQGGHYELSGTAVICSKHR